MFFEVASVVIDAIRMFEFTKETYFFEYVLPFLQGLFATIWHLFDGHDLKFWKQKKSSNYSMSITDSKELNLAKLLCLYGKILHHITLRLQTLLDLKSYNYRAVGRSENTGGNRSKLSAKIWSVPQILRPWIRWSWISLRVSKLD